jgi:hypothetical protein
VSLEIPSHRRDAANDHNKPQGHNEAAGISIDHRELRCQELGAVSSRNLFQSLYQSDPAKDGTVVHDEAPGSA